MLPDFDWLWLIMWLMLILSAMFRSVSEIAVWRITWTNLPIWAVNHIGWLRIDGYHISSNAHWVCMAVFGGLYVDQYSCFIAGAPWWHVALAAIGIWWLHGFIFDLFYHVLFMKKGRKQNFIKLWFKELFRGPGYDFLQSR